MGIEGYFDGVSGKDLCGARKPSSIPYTYLIEKYGYQKEEVIVIEDSVGGVRSAKGAGLYTVGLQREEGICLEEADLRISSLNELRKVL